MQTKAAANQKEIFVLLERAGKQPMLRRAQAKLMRLIGQRDGLSHGEAAMDVTTMGGEVGGFAQGHSDLPCHVRGITSFSFFLSSFHSFVMPFFCLS